MPDARIALKAPYDRWTLVERSDGLWHVETRNAVSPAFPTGEEALTWLEDLYEDWQRAEASIFGGP